MIEPLITPTGADGCFTKLNRKERAMNELIELGYVVEETKGANHGPADDEGTTTN